MARWTLRSAGVATSSGVLPFLEDDAARGAVDAVGDARRVQPIPDQMGQGPKAQEVTRRW